MRARQPGQGALEAALTASITFMSIMVLLQLSMVAAQQFSAAHVARSTARWLAVNMDTTDASVLAQAQSYASNLPGMANGGLSSVTVVPACASLTSGVCSGRDVGVAVTVTVNTSLTPIMFLPTTFGVAPLQFSLPTSMPAMNYTVMLE